jgi:hypothetical protein
MGVALGRRPVGTWSALGRHLVGVRGLRGWALADRVGSAGAGTGEMGVGAYGMMWEKGGVWGLGVIQSG